MNGPDTSVEALRRARADELRLRQRLASLVTERARAEAETSRLQQRASLEGADTRVAEAASAYRERAVRLEADIAGLRAELRAQEGVVAQLAAAAGTGPWTGPSTPSDSP